MNGTPNQAPPPAREYLLLIEPIAISLAPSFFYFFKSTEILQGESFRLKLRITNKGVSHFPGGTLVGGKIVYHFDFDTPILDKLGAKIIDPLPPGNTVEIDCGIWKSTYHETLRIESIATASDGSPVRCYQKLPGGDLALLSSNQWLDFLPVSNTIEVHQRYTNTILIILTFATVIYYFISLFFKFPIFEIKTLWNEAEQNLPTATSTIIIVPTNTRR